MFIKCKSLFIACVIFACSFFNLSAESNEPALTEQSVQNVESSSDNSRRLTKINFSGNTRTSSFYLNSRLKKFIGKPVNEIDMQEFEGILQLEGLFETIKIDIINENDEEASATVAVKEKLAFIPLPVLMYSDNSFTGGFVVLDMNVLGIHDMGVAGGIYNSDFLMAVASYIHTPKIAGFPGFSIFAAVSKNENEYENSQGTTFQKFNGTTISGAFSLMEKIGEHFSVSAGVSYANLKNKDHAKGTDDSKYESTSILSPRGGISFTSTTWDGTFLNTAAAGIDGQFNFRDMDNKSFKVEFRAGNQVSITDSVRLISGIAGSYGKWNHVIQQSGKGDGLSTILPANYKTEEIYGGNLGIEWAAFRTKIGLFSMYALFEAACTYDDYYEIDDYKWVYGPSCGTKLYLSKIAFPAMAIGLSYNIPQNQWYFSAALGISL